MVDTGCTTDPSSHSRDATTRGREPYRQLRHAAHRRDLAEGRPIVVWIQLGQSVPRTWTTPTGAVIHANFAEHTVTLTGWRQGVLTYNDPWTGGRGVFHIGIFIRLWKTLGDRAIAGSSMIGGGQAVARGA